MLRRTLAVIFSLAVFAAVPGVLAQTGQLQTGDDGAGLGELVLSFFNGEEMDGRFVAAPPDEFTNPFGGAVGLGDDMLSAVDMGASFNIVVNPNPFAVPRDLDFDGEFNDVGPGLRIDADPTTLGGPDDQLLGNPDDADGNGILDKDDNDTPEVYDDPTIPPSWISGGAETLERVVVEFFKPLILQFPDDVVLGNAPYTGTPDGLLPAIADALEDGTPVIVSDQMRIVPPMGGPSKIAGRPVWFSGTQVRGPLDVNDCPGQIIEFFNGLSVRGVDGWDPRDFAPNDSFGMLGQATATRCFPGPGWQPAQRLVNNGDSFQPAPTGAIGIITPHAVFQADTAEDKSGASGWVFGAFTTDESAPFQNDTVGFKRNAYPGVISITGVPHIVAPVPVDESQFGTFVGGMTHAAVFNFSQGTCPPEEWHGTFETLHTLDPNRDGVPDVTYESAATDGIDTAVIQYSSNQLSLGLTYVDPYRFEVQGSGADYDESYEFQNAEVNSGTYTYSSGDSTCMWTLQLGEGFSAMLAEIEEEREALASSATTQAPTTTTEAPSTATTGSTATTTPVTTVPPQATTPPEGGATDSGGGGGGLALIIIGVLLLIAALAYWWWRTFYMPPPWQWPCWEEYLAWQKAKRACDEATKKAADARTKAKQATADREEAEKKKRDHCKKYPPACRPPSSASSGGRTVTSDDLWIQSQWAADAWSKYTPGDPASAQATQDQWNKPPSDEFRTKKQAELDAAKAAVKGLDEAVAAAQAKEAAANAAAEAAEAAAAKACADAAAAKAAFDACVGKASAGAGGADAGGDGGGDAGGTPPGGPSAGGGDGGGKRNCAPQQAAYEAAQKVCDEAQEAADAAQDAADDAEEAAEEARQALEDYCEEWPPNCRDDWIEESGKPESRITTKDVYLRQVWAEQVWVDYTTDQIDADTVQQRWKDGPPQSFIDDELRKLEDAKALKPGLEDAVKQAEQAAADAAAKAAEAARAAAEACAEADRARRAFEECVRAAGG